MKCFILQKVPFKLPGKNGRLIWGVLISRSSSDGLCLIYVKKPDENWADTLVAAFPNPKGYFEPAERFVFALGDGDLGDIGGKLKALGEEENEADVRRMFERDDIF